MTDNPTTPPNAPQQPSTGQPDGSVGIDVQIIMDAYGREIAAVTQRALLAEATVAALQQELGKARQTIHALSPGAPTTSED